MTKPQLVFRWEFTLGHVLQLCAGLLVVASFYYTLVLELRTTQEQVSQNSSSIKQLQDSWQRDVAERETRMMTHIAEIKEDIRWLVRNRIEAPKQ